MSSQTNLYDCNDCSISIDSVILERVSQTKFLGVILDDNLLWKSHIIFDYSQRHIITNSPIITAYRSHVYILTS